MHHAAKTMRGGSRFIKPAEGGVPIKILESTYIIDVNGRLTIPADELRGMGLSVGEKVFVAFITDDSHQNRLHEFLMSSTSFLNEDDTKSIAIPAQLMDDAGINPNAELKIICTDGVILIAEDATLHSDELNGILRQLDMANQLFEQLPDDPQAALSTLELITDEEGEYCNDEYEQHNGS